MVQLCFFLKALADMVVHQIVSLFEHFAFINEYEKSSDIKQEEYEKFINKSIPDYLQLLEIFVRKSGKSFLVSDELTWADLAFACFFNSFGERKKSLLYPYKLIKAIDDKVNNLSQIANWKRFQTQETNF